MTEKMKPLGTAAKCILGQIHGMQVVAFATSPSDALHSLNAAGLIPQFLADGAPEDTAITRFRRGYIHGGGWQPFEGFEVSQDDDGMLGITYPGDPVYKEFLRIMLPKHGDKPDEWVSVFPYSWVMVVSDPFGEPTISIARMD